MSANVEGDSPYAVAFRLLEKIVSSESSDSRPDRKSDPRKYMLDLYRECIDAVQHKG